jgi:DNA-directed RNA polymerase specialized sigma24 family protein
MRRILVDWARSHRFLKGGGNLRPVQLEEALVVSPESEVDLVGLDDALEALAAIDPRKSRIMELRFFGGLSVEETAAVLKVPRDGLARLKTG